MGTRVNIPTTAQRRAVRSELNLRRFEHAVECIGPTIDALHWTFGIQATWEAVRRVASEVINAEVTDVSLAWAIVRHEAEVGGEEALRTSIALALVRWRAEVSE